MYIERGDMEAPWIQHFRSLSRKQGLDVVDASITSENRFILKKRDGSEIDAGLIEPKSPGSLAVIAYSFWLTDPDIYVSKDGEVWSPATSEGRYQGGTDYLPNSGCWTGDRFLVPIYVYDSDYSCLLQSKEFGLWTLHPDKVTFSRNASGYVYGMDASGTGVVVAVGFYFGADVQGNLVVSYDFGETWTIPPRPNLPPVTVNEFLTSVTVKNDFEWVVSDGYYFWYTQNGGEHWTEIIWPSEFSPNDSNAGIRWFNGYWWLYGMGSGTDEWDTPLIKSEDLNTWIPVVTPWSGIYDPVNDYLGVNAADSIFVTLLAQATFDTGTASWVTPSYTPTPNALLLAFIETAGFNTDPPNSITANGLTWVLVEVVGYNATVTCLYAYRAMGPAPSAGAMTVVPGYSGQYGQIHIVQATGVSSAGSNGSGAINHKTHDRADESTGAQPAGPGITLTIPGSSDKKVIIAGIANTLNPSVAISPGSGSTGLGSTRQDLAVHRSMITEWKKTTALSIDASVPGSVTQWMGIAIELIPSSPVHNNSSGEITVMEYDHITNTVIANGLSFYNDSKIMMSTDGGENWFEVGYLTDASFLDYGWDGIYKWPDSFYAEGGGLAYAHGWWFAISAGQSPGPTDFSMIRISTDGEITQPVYLPHQYTMSAVIVLSGGDVH